MPSPPVGGIAVAEGADIVFVDGVGGQVALFAQELLILEAVALFGGVVKLAEGVGHFHARDIKFEALNEVRVVGLLLGKRRNLKRIIQDECGLDHPAFRHMLEQFGERRARGGTLGQRQRFRILGSAIAARPSG